jgi:hypothetical protein
MMAQKFRIGGVVRSAWIARLILATGEGGRKAMGCFCPDWDGMTRTRRRNGAVGITRQKQNVVWRVPTCQKLARLCLRVYLYRYEYSVDACTSDARRLYASFLPPWHTFSLILDVYQLVENSHGKAKDVCPRGQGPGGVN